MSKFVIHCSWYRLFSIITLLCLHQGHSRRVFLIKSANLGPLDPDGYQLGHNFVSSTKKYLTMEINNDICGGVGNVMFMIASLHGIGKELKRNSCLQGTCSEKYRIELYPVFHNLPNFSLSKICFPYTPKVVKFAENAWNYDNVFRLHQYDNETLLVLQPAYLQSYKFFHSIRRDVLKMFDFSDSVKRSINDYVRKIDKDNATKVCAHMRREDFSGIHPLRPVEESFTINALKFLLLNATSDCKCNKRLVLLFSDDPEFAQSILVKINETGLASNVIVVKELTRLENIALASQKCDYFLLSSSGSTFGWWMAYLMPDKKQKNIYYNSAFFKDGHEDLKAEWHESDFFPSDWKKIYNETNSVIVKQNMAMFGYLLLFYISERLF